MAATRVLSKFYCENTPEAVVELAVGAVRAQKG